MCKRKKIDGVHIMSNILCIVTSYEEKKNDNKKMRIKLIINNN